MKKAEEYFDYMSSEDDIIDLYNESKEDFIKAIKQAQIDAVEYTVKMCAINVKLYEHRIDPENPSGENDEEPEFWYNVNGKGYEVGIDYERIFNIVDKIKKEL